MLYITINPLTFDLRVYSSKEEATVESIKLNKKSHNHPSFLLWQVDADSKENNYLGRLYRKPMNDFDPADCWDKSLAIKLAVQTG